MADFDARPLLVTETAFIWDVACPGACKHRSDEEYVAATHLVFPYRGVYVHHVGRSDTVAEANQVVILNEDPFEGGDACLSIATSTAVLLELAPEHYLLTKDRAAFNRSRLRVIPIPRRSRHCCVTVFGAASWMPSKPRALLSP
jgi:AraC family transcriptional regulator